MIYFDNAATTYPKPEEVSNAVTNAIQNYGANPGRSGHSLSADTAQAVYSARENIAGFFGVKEAENCIFTQNCTHAINIVLKGLLRRGDHVIISNLEHNAVARPINSLQKRGVEVSRAKVVFGDEEQTARNFARLIKRNTVMIFCTNASNVFGIKLPIAKISEICRKKGILLGVDAAQSAGVISIDMPRDNIDFLCVPAHKGLYGVMGCGALIMSKEHRLSPLIEGGTGSQSMLPRQPDVLPDRFESGTVNVPGICAMSAGVDFVKSRGVENIFRHESEICRYLFENLSDTKNISVYGNYNTENYLPLLSVNVVGMGSEKTAQLLDKYGVAVRAGLHCAPEAHLAVGTAESGTVRLCPSAFTKLSEAEYVVDKLKAIADSVG
ncbi:MAG: aminotransferase class V-fold PLP-dependent enzyme [Oscillospiraceae bacterium]|jgi:cysteine desulfurase family protein|nr:aminotransferase class V-fold PLP-dependent enzyme [Oscillospiraceae bacterium]